MNDLHQLMHLMAEQSASDLFLSCGTTPHIKIDGVTHPVKTSPLQPGEARQMAYSVMTDRQKAQFEEELEANLSFSKKGLGRFRINVFFQRGEVSLVARLIKSEIPPMEELRLPAACRELVMLKRGLILIVGAAGSGKSTTLASMIEYRAMHADGHILTIEDPIEFLFEHSKSVVDQREVGIDTRSFSEALRNAMREAPDVIMIGEVRDRETAQHAIAYAETGHLCLATMHANNANQALERLLNFFPEDAHAQILMDLSMNLKGVVSQRLVPTVKGSRALISEVMLLTPHISDLIQKARIDEIRHAIASGSDQGMNTFDQVLYSFYMDGLIDLQNALQNADSKTDLSLRIRLSEANDDMDVSNLHIGDAETDKRRKI